MAGCLDSFRTDTSTDSITPTQSASTTPTPTDPGFKTSPFHNRPDDPSHGALTLSGGGGSVDVEVFFDYSFDESRQFWNHTFHRLRDLYISDIDTGEEPKITIIHRHFPKPIDKWSMFLPCAMMEVRVQEDILAQKEFHERLFENHFPDYSTRVVEIAATMVGADADEVVTAGEERRYSYAIKSNIEQGEDYGLEEPLGVVVDGTVVEENTAEAIEEAIEWAL